MIPLEKRNAGKVREKVQEERELSHGGKTLAACIIVVNHCKVDLCMMHTLLKREKDEEYQLAMDKKDAVEGIIKVTHLEELLHRHPYDLSGGEQQRLALAKNFVIAAKAFVDG